ncbi:MAG: carboxypeptidase regulatory-like domain-containing protein [Thermoanaerobaculia bacterium]
MHLPTVAGVLLAIACPVTATTVNVPLTVAAASPRGPHVRVVASRVDAESSVAAISDTGAPASVTFDLSPGSWRIVAEARDYVRSERVVTVAGDELTVPLRLVPATAVDGNIRQTRDTAAISSLVITWSPSLPSAEDAPPAGSDECVVQKGGGFRCTVPAGRIDYNLHARGFASVFRWSEDVPVTGLHLRDQSFVPGASLVGRVQIVSKSRMRGPVRVMVTPVELGVRFGDEAIRGAAARNRETSISKRGFFQFDGLAPGRYRVSATGPPLVSHATEIDLIGTAEAELRQPLLLGDARRLTVHLSPPADASGRPWLVELASIQEEAQRSTIVGTDVAKGGVCEFASLLPGVYRVTVRQGLQAQWHSETIDINRDEDLQITIRAAIVRGTVRLGEHPIRATLWFGGDKSVIRVPIRTNGSGQYVVRVPQLEGDSWPEIDVIAEQPSLRRALSDVKLLPTSEDGIFRLDIDLPARAIAGQVVDAEGKPVSGVPVNVSSATNLDRIVNILSDGSGSFAFDGLPAGDYSIHAQDGGRESQVVSISLGERDRVQDVRLVLTEEDRMNVHVTSDFGAVIGARVWLMPTNRSATVVAPVVTDINGNAEVQFRRDETQVDIVVAAPVLPFTFFRTVARSDVPLEVALNRAGSVLKLAWSQKTMPIVGLALKHRGAMLPLLFVYQEATGASASRDGETAVLAISSADPGDYAICDARTTTAGSCAGGMLATGAQLMLQLRPKEQ